MNAKVKKTEKSPFNKLVLNNISQAGKTMIAEYVQRVMSETSDEQWAELRGGASMSGAPVFADLQSEIDKMKLTSKGCSWLKDTTAAQVREILHRVSKLTYKVGGKVVRIGGRIIKWILSMAARIPGTVTLALVLCMLCLLCQLVPFVGQLLLPIVSMAAAAVVAFTAVAESLLNLYMDARHA